MKVPQGWERKKIGSVVNLLSGQHINASDYNFIGQGDPYLTGPTDYVNGRFCITKYTKSPKVKCMRNDVLITCKGSGTGSLIKADREYCISRQIMAVRARKELCKDFLFYLLINSQRYFNDISVGLIPGISRGDILNYCILLPPLPEQKKIAELLSCWDGAIEKTEKLITAKKTFKKSVMQKLLSGTVRFKGFTGKAELKKLKGMIREVSIRNKNSCTSVVLSVTNTSGFVVQTEHFDKSVASEDISNYKIVKKGQFGFNPSRVNVGSIAMLEKDIEGALSPMYVIFETVDDKILPKYMKQFIKSSWFNGHVRCLTQGSVRDSLSFDALEQIKIFAPSIGEQKRIADTLSDIDQEITLLENKRDALKKQKKGLMQKLLTGKIRVKV